MRAYQKFSKLQRELKSMRKKDKKRAKNALLQDKSLSSSSIAKAKRLKRVRNLANLSREEFCSDGEINLATLISWEVGRFGGLSKKGATNIVKRVAKEGVFVTSEWLLYEVGVGPEVRVDFKKLPKQKDNIKMEGRLPSEKTRIMEELMIFKKLNKDSIDFIVHDDAMLPHYQPGDYVAGTKRFKDKIKALIGYDCVVQTSDGQILMRNLQCGPRDDSFNLVPTNLQAKTKNTIIYDVKLASAAPIIWHRRREPS